MNRFLSLFLLTLLPSCLGAAEPAPNTLTGDEIAKGWILLFDGTSTFGWHAPDGSEWKVKDGALTAPRDKEGVLVTTTAFFDYDLELEYLQNGYSTGELRIGCDGRGAYASKEKTELPTDKPSPVSHVRVVVRRGVVKQSELKGNMGFTYIDSDSREHTADLAHGHIALFGKNFSVRSVKLRPRGMGAIFNGKDLAGWKEHPGKKSKFTVSAEGLLNVQNGPGDLQTEKQWANFVLQLECYSNGKHLNSGIFFRCLPGQYQQGYEAQVRNQFTKEPSQEYTVEEYDPKTHQLTGKKTVRSPAVDYGTGAIYRRQPARSQVSRDREWFTLTVVAEGRHLATWVNGIQQTDWTDQRPESDNARNGCRLQKGCISIQGHDPTTDLSFRNFRIGDLGSLQEENPAGKEPIKESARKVKQLQKERIATLKEMADAVAAYYQRGNVSFEEVHEARLQLLQARLDAAEKESDRITLYKSFVDELKSYERAAELRMQRARMTQIPFLKVKARRLEAEINLEQAKAKEAKETK